MKGFMKLKPALYAGLLLVLLLGMKGRKAKRIIFFGDSITQQGVGPGGYVTLLQKMVAQTGAKEPAELIGAGIGGNKVYDLYLRMEEDVLDKNPDVVVIYIGVNDVWHKATSGTGTDPDKFERFYTAIIKKLQARNIHVIVCTPAVIGEKADNSNQQDGDLNRYSQIIRMVAKNNNLPVCDLRKAFMEYEAANNLDNKESGVLTKDRVHLTDKGNQLVADLLLPLIQK